MRTRPKTAPLLHVRRAALAGIVVVSTHGINAPTIAAEQRDADLQCLALTVYHEARGEPDLGKLAVAHVVINRSRDARFPGLICDVVYEGVRSTPSSCEFSWTCDDLSDRPRNDEAWRHSMHVARLAYAGLSSDPTDGAMWYHADYVEPAWANGLGLPLRIGRHRFYRDGAARSVAAAGIVRHSYSVSDTTSAARERPFLPVETIAFLRQLRVTMILYGPDSHERAVRINNAMHRQGDELLQGLTLASIGPDAVVVRYRDRLFRFSL